MSTNAVYGPPQSGKTTIAIDLAFALSRNGQSVCLISPAPYSELSAKLGTKIPAEKSLAAAHKNKESLKQIVHTADDLLYVLAAPFDHDAFGDELPEDTAKAILKQADDLFDVVIVDCPNHANSGFLAAWALSAADRVLLMTGANHDALLWTGTFRKILDPLEDKTYHICAEVNETYDYVSHLAQMDVTPEIWLPHVPNATTVQMLKRTLYQSGGKVGKEYTRKIEELCEMLTGEEGEDE